MSWIADQDFVRRQYEDERRLAARKSAYANTEGPDPRELVWQAIVEAAPRRVLEVGGGEGELAERIVRELDADLVGLDQSERMVEIQRSKGIDARVGDVAELPYADRLFELVVAAWMLYHVPDLDRALGEIARVLQPGGRLVAVTNSVEHMQEIWELAGLENSVRAFPFRSENGIEVLRKHFARVERHDASGWVTMDDEQLRGYIDSLEELAPAFERLPLGRPLRIRRASSIFLAVKAEGA